MGSNRKTTEFLKECMADGLLHLMEQKEFSKITINEIAKAAGVNRSTWFRNFSSKNEALTFKLRLLWNHWSLEHGLAERWQYTLNNATDFFQFSYSIRHILITIYKANLQATVYDAFYQIMMSQYKNDALECYQGRFYSYGLFGMLNEWLKRGFRETPQEMIRLFMKIIDKPVSTVCESIKTSAKEQT